MIGYLGASGFIGRSFLDFCMLHSLEVRPFVRDVTALNTAFAGNPFKACEHRLDQDISHADFDGIDTLVLSVSTTRPNTPGNTIENEIDINLKPHVKFLNGLKNTSVKKLIYLSSGGTVYGDVLSHSPIAETAMCQPTTAYGFGKHCIEGAIANIWKGEGRNYTIIRPSNPVGKHQLSSVGAHGLVTTVVTKIANGQTIKVAGSGETIRDYFCVDDLCQLICNINDWKIDGNLILNASSGIGSSINQVIETAASLLNKQPLIEYGAGPEPDIKYNVLDNTRARTGFDWKVVSDLQSVVRSVLTEPVNPAWD
jgi:UDP-glucose 4-epimerase